MKLSTSKMDSNGNITASIFIKNTGNYDADDVVQLYIRDIVVSITRPIQELKGFKRLHLKKV